MFSKFLYLFFATSFLFATWRGFSSEPELRDQRRELRKLQKEILEVQKKISENEKKESSELFVLNNLDLDIDLTHSVIQDLKKEEQAKKRQIATIEQELEDAQAELRRLKATLEKRLVYFYKYGRIKDLELLLTARSLNQGLLWLEYQKRLANHDHRNFKKIIVKEQEVAEVKQLRTIEFEQHKAVITDKLAKQQTLKQKKNTRQKVLASIRSDVKLLRKQVAAKQRAAEELNRLIAKLQEAPEINPLLPPDTPFEELEGRMIWPAQGKIIRKFGKQRHPELKTITQNIGIDIQAALGSDVLAVATGRVSSITWMRGYGTVVIMRHYGGYWTVYSHFEEVLVSEGQEVEMGQVIGTVGESSSLNGPVLHFEIWKGREKLNPEAWFGRAT